MTRRYDIRSVAIRVTGQGESLRLEQGFTRVDANPYLATAALIAAALECFASDRDSGSLRKANAVARHDLPRPLHLLTRS